MTFDADDPVVKLCAQGMELEGEAKPAQAMALFQEAWNIAVNNVQKFTAAHYLARHQNSVEEKLGWDQTALSYALQIKDESVLAILPSLYLNIAKCHEDLDQFTVALKYYQTAADHLKDLPGSGYGDMIRKGVHAGIERMANLTSD
ncbi:rRNA adenine methyltransferase [Mucilaginibacter sp. 21P]|uniref:hypothetical protein n=1 Tax=Mucilaginibacter sp. 21P TaxID=2778902 RepID=UPI001C583B13|nr:hypothetical protein [Mucilaginibacter sp. 21P]QXV66775.1 rRNA adenine methyltransferase [Mucilaginibacter sp. 21P]